MTSTRYRSKLFITWHLCRDTGQLLTQDVVVGVEKRQLLHHGLFRNKVEDLCKFSIFNNWHAPDRVLPLDPVQNHHFIAVTGAADLSQAVEIEKAWHAHVVKAFSQTVQAADRPQVRNHEAISNVECQVLSCSLTLLWLTQRVCVLSIRQAKTYSDCTPLKKIKEGIFLGFIFTVNSLKSEVKEIYQVTFFSLFQWLHIRFILLVIEAPF